MLVIEEIVDRVARAARSAAARRARAQLLPRAATRRTTARRCGDRSASRASGPSCRRPATFDGALGRGRARSTPRSRARQARPRDHAGEVRHLVHHDVLQPGRRARARLPRRQRAGEPRRHRDGAGPAHEDAGRSRRDELGVPPDAIRADADAHRQGAEHVGDGGVERLRPERRGGARRVRDDARAARRDRRRALRRASRPTIVFAGGRVHPRGAPERRRRLRGGREPGLPARACRSSRPATTARRASTSTGRRGRARRSTTSPTARR